MFSLFRLYDDDNEASQKNFNDENHEIFKKYFSSLSQQETLELSKQKSKTFEVRAQIHHAAKEVHERKQRSECDHGASKIFKFNHTSKFSLIFQG